MSRKIYQHLKELENFMEKDLLNEAKEELSTVHGLCRILKNTLEDEKFRDCDKWILSEVLETKISRVVYLLSGIDSEC